MWSDGNKWSVDTFGDRGNPSTSSSFSQHVVKTNSNCGRQFLTPDPSRMAPTPTSSSSKYSYQLTPGPTIVGRASMERNTNRIDRSSSSSRESPCHPDNSLPFTTPQMKHRTPRTISTSTTNKTIEPSSIIAIVEGRGVARGEIGLACIDLKKPELLLSQFSDATTYGKVISKLQILQPVEILMPNTVCESGTELFRLIRDRFSTVTLTAVQRKYFNETKGLQYIKNLCVPEYKSVELQVVTKYYCLSTAAALLKYVEFIQNVVYAPHSLKVLFGGSDNTCDIDAQSAKFLELIQNIQHPRSCESLYGVLNNTKTVSGARLLRANILQPSCDVTTIESRLNCITELIEKEDMFFGIQTILAQFLDVDHLLSLCIQIPKDESLMATENLITHVIYLKHTLELVEPLLNALEGCEDPLFVAYRNTLQDERYKTFLAQINEIINEDTRYQKNVLHMRAEMCFAVKPNINGLLDIARQTYDETTQDITEMINQMADHYNLPLRTGYNSSRGFFIQMTNYSLTATEQLEQLPAIFVKKTKLKNTLNFTTEDLIKMNDRNRESFNEIRVMSNVVVSNLLDQIRQQVICLYRLTDVVAMLDLVLSLAHISTLPNYVRPEFSDTFAIKNGRHPILERIVAKNIVANSTYLADDTNFIVFTGPNMSGKSTYLKQVALLQIMSQIGCFVPADYASFRIADHIFTRIGSNDDIETNASTFMLEMTEANYILQNVTDKSLVIIDELGRGTSVEEGVGLSFAICEHLMSRKAFCLVATHFQELTKLAELYPNALNCYFEVEEVNKDDATIIRLNYTHVMKKGINPCVSYGIKLAEVSTLPTVVVEDAKRIAEMIRKEREVDETMVTLQAKQRATIQLVARLKEVAKDTAMDESTLRAFLQMLKEQYCDEMDLHIPSQLKGIGT